MLSIDTNELTVKSPGGNLCYLDSLDEFSGDRQITPCRSLSSADIFKAIMELVHTRYNAYGHRVSRIMADSLPAFNPVIAILGAVGILMTLVAPGQHAQRVERSIGSSAAWRRAVLASLPYVLPLQYDLYLLMWIADVANGVPNVHSHPTVPDVLVTGRRRVEHYKYPELRFGQTCMVQVSLEKRQTELGYLIWRLRMFIRLNRVSALVSRVLTLGIMSFFFRTVLLLFVQWLRLSSLIHSGGPLVRLCTLCLVPLRLTVLLRFPHFLVCFRMFSKGLFQLILILLPLGSLG